MPYLFLFFSHFIVFSTRRRVRFEYLFSIIELWMILLNIFGDLS